MVAEASPRFGLKLGYFLKTIPALLLLVFAVGVYRSSRSSQTSLNLPWPVASKQNDQSFTLPRVIIYRRSIKTASTSMTNALLQVLVPLGYVPIANIASDVGKAHLYSNLHNPNGRPVFFFRHNRVTRNITNHNDVIIMDTFRDGYQQMTSYCRFRRGVQTCDQKLVDCLRNDQKALRQRYYRWAQHESEDSDTFIDIPLSSEYPALSTAAVRAVIPNAVLELDHFREKNSTCPEIPELRAVYNELYQEIEDQVHTLRIRLLTLAGYPYRIEQRVKESLSLVEMLDHAERMEAKKHNFRPPKKGMKVSMAITEAKAGAGAWTYENGKWVVAPSSNMQEFENIEEQERELFGASA